MKNIGWQVYIYIIKRTFANTDKTAVLLWTSSVLSWKGAIYVLKAKLNHLRKNKGIVFPLVDTRKPKQLQVEGVGDGIIATVMLCRTTVRLCDKCPWYEKAPTSFDMEQCRRLKDTWLKALQENREGC